jgi:hypothetical protein
MTLHQKKQWKCRIYLTRRRREDIDSQFQAILSWLLMICRDNLKDILHRCDPVTSIITMFTRPIIRHLIRGQRLFSSTSRLQADFTHAVIGGGAVGLAIARQLQGRDGASTVLIEKHGTVGTETSSRNSEVKSQFSSILSGISFV